MYPVIIPFPFAAALLASSVALVPAAVAGPIAAADATLTATIVDVRNLGGGGLDDFELAWTDFGETQSDETRDGGTVTATTAATASGLLGVGDVIRIELTGAARVPAGRGSADVANARSGTLVLDNFSGSDTFELDLQLAWAAGVQAVRNSAQPATARAFASLSVVSSLFGDLLDADLLAATVSGVFDPAVADTALVTLSVRPSDFSDTLLFGLVTDATVSAVPAPGTLGLLVVGVLAAAGRRRLRPRAGQRPAAGLVRADVGDR